ncbi:glycosyltransferase family A protein [Cesiribacter sp. SM1]|uniref:glycosyltransferase family A protein n=1 Tax=Cesiribacter sp. SM1 TaxID=2861196 RepID=UPI001CD2D7E8|nr:glycosyltransferase family 2 protein [Cesiribacter sp. SM1]
MEDQSSPDIKFSVIVPVYNRADIIGKTIESVLRQEYACFELILVDDGSTDHTSDVIQNYERCDLRIKSYSIKNSERGAARNFGIRQATGNYLVFLDSDDLFHADHLSTLCAYIIALGAPAFLATKYNFFDGVRHFPSDLQPLPEGDYDYRYMLKGNSFACNFCVKNTNDLILFEEDRSVACFEDWMFLVENLKQHKLFLIDRVTVTMHDHPGRSMRGANEVLIRKRLKASRFLEQKLLFDSKEKQVLNAYSYYFCAIHAYLDYDRKASMQYTLEAIKSMLQPKFLLMLPKVIFGKRLINKLLSMRRG